MQIGLAEARQERLTRLADAKANTAVRMWRRGMTADFDASWQVFLPQLLAAVAAGQVQAAAGASPFLAQVARADEVTEASGGNAQPQAWTGVDASGRETQGLLYGAVTTAKTAIGEGRGLQSAFLQGATYLAVMVKTVIHDTGRSADLTAMTSRGYTEYIRVVNPGACSRCAILAGKLSARQAFKRHPGCRCGSSPRRVDDDYDGKYANATDYFNSLDAAEQDRVFTKAGAEAIRAGADPQRIVAARRGGVGIDYGGRSVTSPNSGRRLQRTRIGTRPDGSAIMGYTTGEGTTIRGDFGRTNRDVGLVRNPGARYRSTKRVRLLPESIVPLTDDVELRKVLLRDAGYLDVPLTAEERAGALGGGYAQRRINVLAHDRQIAADFYRSKGIQLD